MIMVAAVDSGNGLLQVIEEVFHSRFRDRALELAQRHSISECNYSW